MLSYTRGTTSVPSAEMEPHFPFFCTWNTVRAVSGMMTAEDSSSCGFSAACPMPVLRRRAVLSAATAVHRRVMFIRVISFSFVMAR